MATTSLLWPRDAAQFIAEQSKDVKILQPGIKAASARIFSMLKNKEQVLDTSRWQLHELNPKSQDDRAIDWIFLVDLLNFSFWTEDDQPKYTVTHGSGKWTGYWSLCAAVNRALDEGVAITDPKVFGSITREQLEHIVRPDVPSTSMPLIDNRLECLHQAGAMLCQKYGGSFANAVRQCNSSASKLLQLIVDDFPCFRDYSQYEGQQGQGLGAFDDIDSITAFADYRVPQALIWFGAMQYSDSLMDALKKNEMLENGDRREVEIRGCTLWAVELMVKEIKQMIENDAELSKSKVPMNGIIIDHFLWDFRREHDAELKDIPFHRTRCIYY